jgi:hypothetical protein
MEEWNATSDRFGRVGEGTLSSSEGASTLSRSLRTR